MAKTTRTLLACGVVAGPLYVAVGVIQLFIRPGFDIRRHALSLLSNGELGWIQIANFAVTGALPLASAAGIRRALQGTRDGTWGPLFLGLYGFGLIGAAIFNADPSMGFPPGTPEVTTISTHGLMHLVLGSMGFMGFVAMCFVFARRFTKLAQPRWAAFSVITGVLFMAAFIGIASGSKGGVSLPFALAVVLGFMWISMLTARLREQA